jgi:signal transduction histidine kinase/CheY-like chemotaxis protein/HPt (histidine-containing phosphotransfer) domain-containing protein
MTSPGAWPPEPEREGRAWSLRAVLLTGLLLFSALPAASVCWLLYTSKQQSVQILSDRVVGDLARRVQSSTEEHVAQAHTVLNGLAEEVASDVGVARARQLMQKPELFEQTAFAMTRMTQSVPHLYLATYRGEYVGVETLAQDSGSLMRVGAQRQVGEGLAYFLADTPGDRRTMLPGEAHRYEPRERDWYRAAIAQKGRIFTPVQASAAHNQLLLTLAQPVYGAYGNALGVFAVDLHLKHLDRLLQTLPISAHGVAFVVDEQGFLVASSTSDPLFQSVDGQLVRSGPMQSRHEIVRSAYAEAKPRIGKTQASGVQRVAFLRRVAMGDGTLVVAMQPFGEKVGLRWSLVVAAPESDFTVTALRQGWAVMAVALLLGVVLATGLAYCLSRRFKRLGAGAAQMACAQVPQLAQMVALQGVNETLQARLASHTTELLVSREDALAAARAKAAFLATMSHEIRTPLNGVLGMATLLADTPLDAAQRDYVQTMRVSSDQLLGVINDILDFSRIESGQLSLENEALDLLATLDEACQAGAPAAREKGLALRVDRGDDLPAWVRGDVTRLRQVLRHLVNNAVKFTGHGTVTLSARVLEDFTPQQGALIEFRVRDTGIGIAQDQQSALFQPFTQVDASTTRQYGGTGLGLAISKRLAGLMGGSIGLESALGAGSSFWFTARLGQAEMPQAATLPLPQPPGLPHEQAAVMRQRILVVDDNAINLKVALAMLAKLGYEAATCINGREAVDLVAASLRTGTGETPRQYAAILMDVNMPEMDGFAASRQILALHGDAAPPIVALTASALDEDRQRCRDAGMQGFLAKPLRIDELLDAMARYARKWGAEPAIEKIAPRVPSPSARADTKKGDDAAPGLMDWSRLEQFHAFDDEERSMTREVIALFAGEAPKRIDDMRAALAAVDGKALSWAAHALMGAASNVGAQALSDACAALEHSCRLHLWPEDAVQQVAAMSALSDKTCQALQGWLPVQ